MNLHVWNIIRIGLRVAHFEARFAERGHTDSGRGQPHLNKCDLGSPVHNRHSADKIDLVSNTVVDTLRQQLVWCSPNESEARPHQWRRSTPLRLICCLPAWMRLHKNGGALGRTSSFSGSAACGSPWTIRYLAQIARTLPHAKVHIFSRRLDLSYENAFLSADLHTHNVLCSRTRWTIVN